MDKQQREEQREIRDRDLLAFDDDIRSQHHVTVIAGVDEAGRGPLAGPVVAAAVILPPGTLVPGADDSKVLSPEKREHLYRVILKVAIAWSWALVQPRTIDRINILQANRLAIRRALAGLETRPEVAVIDGLRVPRLRLRQVATVDGDALSLSVACASILAKVRRDRLMVRKSRRYPGYDFAANKGYGTPAHLEALDRLGPCALHRKSFMPVAQIKLGLQMSVAAVPVAADDVVKSPAPAALTE